MHAHPTCRYLHSGLVALGRVHTASIKQKTKQASGWKSFADLWAFPKSIGRVGSGTATGGSAGDRGSENSKGSAPLMKVGLQSKWQRQLMESGWRGWAQRMWQLRPDTFLLDTAAILKVLVGYVQVGGGPRSCAYI